MKVLMISIDKGLLGQGQLGDVVERHKKYGEFCERLDIIVLCKKRGYKINKISNKVTVYPTNSINIWHYYFRGLKLGKKLSIKNDYDLIVCQDPFITGLIGLKLKKKYGTKLLIHFHGDYKFPFWRVVKNADGIRVMSQGQKDGLIKKGFPTEKIRVISTPVNIEYFENYNNRELVEQLKIKANGRKVVLMIGRKDPVKDFDTLFKTINLVYNQNNKICLWLIGNYDNLSEIKSQIKLPADQTQCFGRIKINDLPAYYQTAEIIVSSSKSESFGKVLVEANACGKPVVATTTTGAKEIVQDGVNGFLVPIGNYQILAEKILWLLDNPQQAREMGEKGKNLVKEKFDGEKNIQKIISFWQELIK